MCVDFINPDGTAFAEKFAQDIPLRGAHVTHDEMWELWVHSKFWIATNQAFGWSVEQSYQVLSCAAGAVFVFLLLCYWITLLPGRPIPAFVLCMAAGYVQLFFGDVENYTITAMLVMAYLLAAVMFLEGRWSVSPAACLLAVSITFHLEAGFLGPSLLYLLAVAVRRGQWASVSRGVAGACAIVVGTLWFFHLHGLPLRSLYYESHAFGRGGNWDRMIVTPSVTYYAELASLALLLAPALGLLIPLVRFRRIPLDAINVHLLLASGFMALFMLSWNAALGVYNDWNLFAIAAIPVTLLIARNVLNAPVAQTHPESIAALTLLFLVHSASWIVANHYS